MKVQMTEKYIRAVAKIGFHFFLKYFPEFKQVKRNPIAGFERADSQRGIRNRVLVARCPVRRLCHY
jgi:hypothetical protein